MNLVPKAITFQQLTEKVSILQNYKCGSIPLTCNSVNWGQCILNGTLSLSSRDQTCIETVLL